MKTTAIIQARLGSTRLPGKVLLKILDKTILEYVIERVKKAKAIDFVIVATTTKEEDLRIVDLATGLGVHVYQGSEDDVLDRFYQAAKSFEAKHIVRITADCPLIDPKIIDDVISWYFDSHADYCSNILKETFPDGEDVEVFSFCSLERAWENADLFSEKEHVTSYIRKNPDKFKLVNLENEHDLSGKRWTLDQKEDFKFLKSILEALHPANPDFCMKDVLNFLRQNPHLENVNSNIVRNAGYLESLNKDRGVNTDNRGN